MPYDQDVAKIMNAPKTFRSLARRRRRIVRVATQRMQCSRRWSRNTTSTPHEAIVGVLGSLICMPYAAIGVLQMQEGEPAIL
jgi:hypothetical protein